MKKNFKKIISVLLLVNILISNNIYAKSFSDISATGSYKWAFPAVDSLSDKGIFGGYPDGSFKPSHPVSFLEVLQLIKNIDDPSVKKLDVATKEYDGVAEKYNIPNWAKDAVCFALSKNIVTERTMAAASEKGFLRDKNTVYPNRNSVTVYFGRAMGFSGNGDLSILKHKDLDGVPEMTKGYLAELVDAGIFADTGSNGYFNGKKYIRRSEVAVICNNILKYYNSEDNHDIDKNDVVDIFGDVESVSGVVQLIRLSGEESILTVNDEEYDINLKVVKMEDVSGKYNGDILTLKGANVTIAVDKGKVIGIRINAMPEVISNDKEDKEDVIINEPSEDKETVEITGRVIDYTKNSDDSYKLKVRIIVSDNSHYITGEEINIDSKHPFDINEIVMVRGEIDDLEVYDR